MSSVSRPEHFDTVIVGGGSAGVAVAAALGAQLDQRVLMLEAGPAELLGAPEGLRSANLFTALAVPDRQWHSTTVQHRRGGPESAYVRARTLGGGSAINAMVCLPAAPQDFDEWATLYGATEWSYAHVRSCQEAIVGRSHRVPLGRCDDAVAEGLRELGLHPTDLAVGGAVGFGALPLSLDDGPEHLMRRGAVETYLRPPPSNLTVRGHAVVQRLNWAGSTVTGVELDDGAVISTDRVVSCAGVVGSPMLLWRSHIDLPGIGLGLQDHPGVSIAVRWHNPDDEDTAGHRPAIASGARLSSDLLLLVMNQTGKSHESLGALSIALTRPSSRGVLCVQPNGHSVLEPQMLEWSTDRIRMRAGVRNVLELLRTSALRHAVAEFDGPDTLGDDDIDRWVLQHLGDWYHGTGTCRMGPPDDQHTVVDQTCRVRGFDNLYVIDASVMPTCTSATTAVAVSVVAERAGAWLAHSA